MKQVEQWIWLAQAMGAGSPKSGMLLSRFGSAEAVYGAGPEELNGVPDLTLRDRARLSDKSLSRAQAAVGRCLQLGCRVVTPGDAAYPPQLGEIYAPPCVLYVMGELPPADALLIAVVGTRRATEYGVEAATRLAVGLASRGAVVVSGLAYGIDTASHKGALKGGGQTVAVIGCGADYNYPAGNRELKRLIAAHGAVVSEFEPGVRPYTANFPIRNRIIAGLCRGTVVVEAGSRSGSLITAGIAAESGRDVFAVPGNIFSPMSEGTNRLLRDGAKPCCGVADILEEYLPFLPQSLGEETAAATEPAPPAPDGIPAQTSFLPVSPSRPPKRRPPAGLSRVQSAIYGLLTTEPVHVDTIALRANLEPRVVLSALTVLEVQGLARSLPGRRFMAG